MRRITVSLTDDLADALDREARRQSKPASVVARDALTNYLGVGRSDERCERPFAAFGHSGQNATARDMEELLEQEWAHPVHDH